VLVDFGVAVFDGTAYWLELGVRTNGSSGAFTTLSPRQILSASPYALYALSAGSGRPGNTVSGSQATVGGGIQNESSGDYATVGGGNQNRSANPSATIAGGDANRIEFNGDWGAIGGGHQNKVLGQYAFVGGGDRNCANGP